MIRFLGWVFGEKNPLTWYEWKLHYPWPAWALALFMLAGGAYVLYLYYRQEGISLAQRLVWSTLRIGSLLALLLLLLDPVVALERAVPVHQTVLVLCDGSLSMSVKDVRHNTQDLADAALALGQLDFPAAGDENTPLKVDPALATPVSRAKIMQSVLAHPQLRLLENLRSQFEVKLYRFGDKLQSIEPDTTGALKDLEPRDGGTALGSALEEALDRNAGQPLAGVVVFTDGGVNKGLDPLAAARRAGRLEVPVFPVGLGVMDVRDVRMREIAAQEVAHTGDEMPVRVQFDSHGYTGRETEIVLTLGKEEVARRKVRLNGGLQTEELRFTPKGTGALVLRATIPPFADESNLDNNAAEQFLKVIDEKIKVLYVEGSPRWEYRYLRQVLLRDGRLEVTFLMTEGDAELPQHSKQYLAEFPKEAAEAYRYDLVILGDVQAAKLTAEQMERIEEMVRKRGVSFLMLGGHFYAPREYAGTPLEKLLPVTPGAGANLQVPPTLRPRLTPEGERSAIMRLDPDNGVNHAMWALVNPLYELPRIASLKPGATVLATLNLALPGAGDGPAVYPLIAWQRYGTGKSLYIGTDQLWRLRFKRGDMYHARFWNQAIQVLTFSRLLGENKRIYIETDTREYQIGTRVQLSASVENELFEPLKAPQFVLEAQERSATPKTAAVALQAVPDCPGKFQGYYTVTTPAVVAFRAQGAAAEDSNTVEVNVIDKPLELQDTELQAELLKQMAAQSNGRYFTVRDLPQLPGCLAAKTLTAQVHEEKRIAWPLFVLVVLCAGIEWFLRRRNDLC